MKAAYQQADYVVQVHVQSLQDTVQYDLYSQPVHPPFRAGAYPVVRVQKVVKGPLAATELQLAGRGSLCDFYFKVQEDYVVFLYKTDKNSKNQYVTSSCQRHFLVADKQALAEFRQVAAP